MKNFGFIIFCIYLYINVLLFDIKLYSSVLLFVFLNSVKTTLNKYDVESGNSTKLANLTITLRRSG